MLIFDYGVNLFKSCQFFQAHRILTQKCDAEHQGMSYYLQGLYNKFGLPSVVKDETIAEVFFQEALAKGYLPAAVECKDVDAKLYLDGIASLAEKGDSFAKVEMGHYFNKNGETTEARKWFREAVEEENYFALVELLKTYFGTDYSQDMDEVIALLKLGEAHGIEYCISNLAWFYYLGKGVEQNTEVAIAMLESITDKGYVDDFPARILDKILRLEAEKGNLDAHIKLYFYSDLYDTDWVEKAIDLGSDEAMVVKASCFDFAPDDKENAYMLYRKAAEQGNAEAMFYIGECIEDGRITANPNENDLYWYMKAADLGHPQALLRLAQEYLSGDRLPKDADKTKALVRQAVLNGANFDMILRYQVPYMF